MMRRTLRLGIPLVALALALAVAAPARAADLVGIGDQHAAMFASPHFDRLDVRVSRLIVSYDAVMGRTFEVADIDAWMAGARARDVEPLVAFNHARGCYDGRGVVKGKRCRLPSVKRYRKAITAFLRRYPDVRAYSPWNEVNHRSQPTARHPERAAAYYDVMRRSCRRCTIVAADVLDQTGIASYLKRFRRATKGKPRLWGLHNYRDVNNGTSSGTRRMLRTVPGHVWLTETGGIVKFGRRSFSPSRAAAATRFLFRLSKSSRRITRLYIYSWFGEERGARFDAGLTNARGVPRPAYDVVLRHLRRPGNNPPPPTPSPSPSPGPSPSPSPGPSPSPLPDPLPWPDPSSWPDPSPSPSPTPAPSPTPSPEPCTPLPC
jgi:hypothetical protein